MKKPGLARGSIPTSRVKGGGRAALHGATVRQHCRRSRRDGAAGQQELPRPAARETGRPQSWAGQAGDRLWPARCGRVRLRRAAASERRGSHPDLRASHHGQLGRLPEHGRGMDRSGWRAGLRGARQLQHPPRARRAAVQLLHPRWEFVFQPKYAAYLNLIERWWKVLRSLALKGRRFETWTEIEEAVARATAYWNDHRHPFIWGRRRRHRQSRRLGIAAVPNLTLI